jgi:hypothetical protein
VEFKGNSELGVVNRVVEIAKLSDYSDCSFGLKSSPIGMIKWVRPPSERRTRGGRRGAGIQVGDMWHSHPILFPGFFEPVSSQN